MPVAGGDFDLVCNTSAEVFQRNIEVNQKREYVRRFSTLPPNDFKVAIVGGGPSLIDSLPEIKARAQNGVHIWATNNTFRLLQSHGITPRAHVILDPRPENREFLTRDLATTYFLHISCDPSLYDDLQGCRVCMYDLRGAGGELATGSTVGLKALYLAGFSGFSEFYLYGFDSSYRDDNHHAYPQALNDGEPVLDVTVGGQTFRAAPWMVVQAEEFQNIARSFRAQGKVIHVAGDGLLPHVARLLAHQPKVLTAVWDLMLCPTSYDFSTFIGEAESKRIENGAEFLDVVIQPGPMNGFRNDDLPGKEGNREGMLYRVIVGMARLLPSVRNIEVLKARRAIEGDVFPDGYEVDNPKAHYGHAFFVNAKPILQASVAARSFVQERYRKPYVTITLREATHWPARNSNRSAWMKAAAWLDRKGYEVVWVPDTESHDPNIFSFDLDMRVALYERAVVNLGINNGPTMTIPYTDASYILFKMVTESVPWTTREFHERWGTIEGDQPNGRGRFVFEPDDYETIVKELEQYFELHPLRKEVA